MNAASESGGIKRYEEEDAKTGGGTNGVDAGERQRGVSKSKTSSEMDGVERSTRDTKTGGND